MKRKIIGIFIIALLTISYMPMVSSEASQAPESNENKGGDINFFFTGRIGGQNILATQGQIFLAKIGIYKEIKWIELSVKGGNIFFFDGELIHLESPCTLKLYNLVGFGTPFLLFLGFIRYIIPPIGTKQFTLIGSCESYDIPTMGRAL
jgi:hypothetical protein